jgi:hypothetical protein
MLLLLLLLPNSGLLPIRELNVSDPDPEIILPGSYISCSSVNMTASVV